MARVCVRHPFELSDNFCGYCGQEFCRGCLVYPKGPKKAALCVSCAIAASGVRSTAAKRPPISKRDLKRRMKERETEQRVLARHERTPAPIDPIMNPLTPGWAVHDEEPFRPAHAPEPVTPPDAPEPLLAPPPAPAGAEVFVSAEVSVGAETPTLADLLPSVPSTPSATTTLTPTLHEPLDGAGERTADGASALSILSELPGSDSDATEERKHRSLPLLRRREPEPVDDGSGASEMIAWLDEVFAPKTGD